MKKFASVVAAGAILMSSVGVAFAGHDYNGHDRCCGSVSQFSFTSSKTSAVSDTGLNRQEGAGTQAMVTGGSGAKAGSLTAGNVNVSGRTSVRQGAFTSSETGAESYTGSNTQVASAPKEERHHGHHDDDNGTPTSQSMVTGGSGATAGSVTVSNVNLSFQ